MPARRITTVTIPIDAATTAGLRSYPGRTPLLTVRAGRPPLMVTLTLPEHLDDGHVRFARELADTAAWYATEVERAWRGLPALHDRIPA